MPSTHSHAFHDDFFAKPFTWPDLKKICEAICASEITIHGKTIPTAMYIKGKNTGAPFLVLAQLHGNEPAGLAGIALAQALAATGELERDVVGMIGNPIAAQQYFAAWEKSPHAAQETRDCYRGGIDTSGKLLPDMNRIPVDFMTRDASDAHIKRAQELWAVGQQISGILDIHSARGNMLCITDHKYDGELKNSPIRAVLTNLAEAISANASATVTVQTLKTILHPLPNIKNQVGIEAGRHENPESPHNAAAFTLALFHTLGLTRVPPLQQQDDGIFEQYTVQPRITYADLRREGELKADDRIYMAKMSASGAEEHQYDEMEPVEKGQLVAIAKPSGARFYAPFSFSGIFVSKSAALYDKDPSVGPWPVAADNIASVKFCYPCNVSKVKLF